MYLGGPLGLMSIGLMAILVRGLGLLMLGVASTAGQLSITRSQLAMLLDKLDWRQPKTSSRNSLTML